MHSQKRFRQRVFFLCVPGADVVVLQDRNLHMRHRTNPHVRPKAAPSREARTQVSDEQSALKHSAHLTPDNPGNLSAILFGKRQRHPHVHDPRKHAVTVRHPLGRRVSP